MAFELRLQQKMAQQLVMTPQLQQAIKLLQLSRMELTEAIRQELNENPMLEEPGEQGPTSPSDAERDFDLDATPEGEPPMSTGGDAGSEDGELGRDLSSALEAPPDATPEPTSMEVDREIDWEAYLESYSYSLPATAAPATGEDGEPLEANFARPTSLAEHLLWQVHMWDFTPTQARIAAMLVEEVNEDGYLPKDTATTVAEDLGVSLDEVEVVIAELQTFDPVGVAARGLQECLLAQVRHLSVESPVVVKIIEEHIDNLQRQAYQAIAKALKVPLQEVNDAIRVIASLEPKPGRVYSDRQPQYITPDIYVHKVGEDYVILLNEDGLPKLRISNYYRQALQDSAGSAKSYIQDKLRSAAWLIRSIHMRQRTIYRVMESILKSQREFFDRGPTHLKPLILRDVASDVDMHESTISRVTTNKYVHTPQGIFELKYFFNSSISRTNGDSIASESVRNHIRRLVTEEDPRLPLSDQQIVEALRVKNIEIARRTVAKYREMLRIPSSSKRRKSG